MLTYRKVATLVSSKAGYSSNITDMVVADVASGPVLVSSTATGNSLSYALSGADDPARGLSRKDSPGYGLFFATAGMEVIERDGTTQILYSGLQNGLHTALTMDGSGKLGGYVPLFPRMTDDIVSMTTFEIAGIDYMLAGCNGSTRMMLFRMEDGAAAVKLGEVTPPVTQVDYGEYTDIDVVNLDGARYAVAASAHSNFLAVFAVSPNGLALRGHIDASYTVGISAPRDVEIVTTLNGTFLIVSGGQSDSLSVFRMAPSGAIGLTDHVVDSGNTRFDAATAMTSVELDGRAYIFVGGADDGVTVLTLDGQGRLVVLAVIEDDAQSALANISAIEAKVIGGKIAVFVTSATETGITQFSFDPGNIGTSRAGSGRVSGTTGDDILVGTGASSVLVGGAGDDILIAREGTVNLQGGHGRDIFVPCHGTRLVTIHDFAPGYDTLDLSELAFIRSISQLQITPTSTGAALVAGPLRIEIITANGVMLRPDFFTNDMFRLAHYANDINYKNLVVPVDNGSGNGSTPPSNGNGNGLPDPAPLPPPSAGNRVRFGTNGSDVIQVPGGNEYVHGLSGDDLILGNWGDDKLHGGWGNDTIRGAFGDDYMLGDGGSDTMLGQLGNDRMFGDDGHDLMIGGLGDDRLFGQGHNDTLIGQEGDDVLFGGPGYDELYGGLGNDLLIGGADADKLFGDDGNDRIIAIGAESRAFGGPGNDQIELTEGRNIALGDAGLDSIYGGSGDDLINLGEDDDVGYGRMGVDTIAGGPGNDRIYGGVGDDILIGDAGDDRLHGELGNDFVTGLDGDDLIYGQAGFDTLVGGSGSDTMDGGFDADTLWGGDGDDDLSGDYGPDVLNGQAGDDRLRGGVGNDILDGGDGNDTMFGELNHDHLTGGEGDDLLLGNAGHDTLLGGPGSDTLIGDAGRDVLCGGVGADIFVFAPPADGMTDAADIITDFESGVDLIDLSQFSAVIDWIGSDPFSATGRNEVRLVQLSDRVQLSVDGDGDGDVDLLVDIAGTVTPFDLVY
ncbi:hypothetical protein FQV27_06720 [Paracoccus aurantiacus]|uniref:Peptidase M10 serralysin C-terminal domain-containing protein n=1 Tax=Paracoccus aurantiacus TaxID=2599412 RepID=A0A5C6S4R1_9RHOB|nr:calcium-binding protein [Paracoccus aurantiacus]TXB69808.1 hypothetical protein FQV27_06720 [Paracoccus aurantiacus]